MYNVIYKNFAVKEESNNNRYLQMDAILKRLFTIENTIPIIDFLNAAFKDNLSYDCKIIYTNTEIINNETDIKGDIISSGLGYIIHHSDLYISAHDKERKFEYAVEFQTKFDESIGIRMFRYGFERAAQIHKVINKSKIIIEFPKPYLILLEEENEVEDLITLEVIFPKMQKVNFNINVLKYWKYDLQSLYEENMYLLYPLQIFKLRKDMERISKGKKGQKSKTAQFKELHRKLITLIKDSNKAIDKALQDGKIDIRTCNEMVTALANLNAYLVDVYELPDEIESEVRYMVESFYLPEAEERGIKKGKLETKREDIIELLEDIGNVSDEIRKLVDKEEDTEILKRWLKIAARAKSIDDFLHKVKTQQ